MRRSWCRRLAIASVGVLVAKECVFDSTSALRHVSTIFRRVQATNGSVQHRTCAALTFAMASLPDFEFMQSVPVVVPAVLAPAIAMLLGGLAAGRLQISVFGLCASQYFSAGMILAVCGALMKELAEHGLTAAIVLSLGFGLGVASMVFVKRISESIGPGETQSLKSTPWPLLMAVAIDSLVDGLLLGMIGVETPRAVPLMSAATALEMGALGLSFAASVQATSKRARALSVVSMPLVLVLGGFLGAMAAAPLRSMPLAYSFMVSFGIAALLYLVTQELLVEAEERRQTLSEGAATATAMCLFAGYLLVIFIEVAFE